MDQGFCGTHTYIHTHTEWQCHETMERLQHCLQGSLREKAAPDREALVGIFWYLREPLSVALEQTWNWPYIGYSLTQKIHNSWPELFPIVSSVSSKLPHETGLLVCCSASEHGERHCFGWSRHAILSCLSVFFSSYNEYIFLSLCLAVHIFLVWKIPMGEMTSQIVFPQLYLK